MPPTPVIPIFPLPIVALPNETVPLHIFEERYKEMIAFCRQARANHEFHGFGIVQEQNNRVFDTGCLMEIKKVVREYEDGRLDIVTLGVQRFKVEEIYSDQTYFTARVHFIEDKTEPVDPSVKAAVGVVYQRLVDLMGQDARLAERIPPGLDVDADAFELGAELGMELRVKQRLLEMQSETERLILLRDHLDKLVTALEAQQKHRRQSEEQHKKVAGNGHLNGHLN